MATQGRRRAFGQHFLRDQSVCLKIAETALQEAARNQCVALMEVGPGKGAITFPLLDLRSHYSQIQKFFMVEKDRNLVSYWQEQLEDRKKQGKSPFTIESGDFLLLPEEKWLSQAPMAVVSNLPYSSGTAILNRLARQRDQIPVMVLMFQSEVAKRLRAEPSTPDRGSLSLWIQNHWDVQKLIEVPPRAFSPPPQVDSEVVILRRRKSPWIPGTEDSKGDALWESLLKLAFSQRRKMLRSIFNSKEPWQKALELSGVDGTKRAEALQWSEWEQLFQALF